MSIKTNCLTQVMFGCIKGDTTQDIQTDIQNIADDMFHTNTIEQSTIIEQTDTSMPFTTTEVLKKKEP